MPLLRPSQYFLGLKTCCLLCKIENVKGEEQARSMKTIMILGAGEGQTPFISICKKRGYRTIVVSPQGDYPGFAMADKAYYFDTRDKENILAAARKEHIDAITTDQTDVAVPTVAYVAEKLGLRGIGCDLAGKLTNKYEMRKAAKTAGIATPEFGNAESYPEALQLAQEIGFPVIIKPVDSSGSRGVIKISTPQELKKNFPAAIAHSAAGEIIVEKFLQGREYLADGFAANGQYNTLDVGIKEYFNLPDRYVSKLCIFYSVNSKLDKTMEKVKSVNDQLFTALGFPFGITHAEYIYSPNVDKVYLVECAGRGGGVFLSSHLTPWATGYDTNTRLIDYLMEGIAPSLNPETLAGLISAWMCFSLPDGVVATISGQEKLLAIPGVKAVYLDQIKPGKRVSHLQSDQEKYGPILLCADSISEIRNAMQEVKKVLKITLEHTDGNSAIIW